MTTAIAVDLLKQNLPDAIVEENEFLGETTLTIAKEHLRATLQLLKQAPSGYVVLIDLTAVDYLEPIKYAKIVYWLHNPETYARLRIVVDLPRQEKLPSIVDLWRGADWYERELFDLFGVEFEGRLKTERILMPDDWRGHPLRRDYALTEESVQFKHGVKPKVPSEIIPYVKYNKNS